MGAGQGKSKRVRSAEIVSLAATLPVFNLGDPLIFENPAVISAKARRFRGRVSRIRRDLGHDEYFYLVPEFSGEEIAEADLAAIARPGVSPGADPKQANVSRKLFGSELVFKSKPRGWGHVSAWDMELFDGKPVRVLSVERRNSNQPGKKYLLKLAFKAETDSGGWSLLSNLDYYLENVAFVPADGGSRPSLEKLEKVVF